MIQILFRMTRISAVLDLAAEEWLKKSGPGDDDEAQRRLHRAALKCFGSLASGDPLRAENAATAIRQRLRRHYGR